MQAMLRHQNVTLALRQEMGLPAGRLANDAVAFTSGKPSDVDVDMDLGRLTGMLNKDVIYSGWKSLHSPRSTGFTIAYREMLSVDIIPDVVPYASDANAAIVLVSTRLNQHFAINTRGSLVRVAGKPKRLSDGRQRAMRRILAAAATIHDQLLPSNRSMEWGGMMEPDGPPTGTIVRFA